MRKYKKKLVVGFLAITLTLTGVKKVAAASPAIPNVIYETSNSVNLGSGVKHEHIKKFTGSQWVNINIMRVDMENEYTELKGMFNKNGIPNRDTVSGMVNKHGAIGGVNGDYFNYSPLPSAMGTLINDGRMISSPIEKAYALPTLSVDYDNKTDISYIDRSIVLDNLRSNDKVIINTLNKVTPEFDTPTLLDSNWGNRSIGRKYHRDLVEIVIEEDTVIDVRRGKDATAIPKDGYVVAGRGQRGEILKNFKIGDKVDLKVNTSPDIENIKFAIGAGSIILKDGQPMATNIHSSGNQPRTGIGVNKDNTELILVTVDGRSSKHHGIGQEKFGELLKELGSHHGVNLDGGGSTTMAVKFPKTDNAKIVNKPSSGYQRPVVNGVGVFTKAPKGELDHIEINCSEPSMHVDTSRNISITGYDAYKDKVEIERSLVDITIEGVEAEIVDGYIFKPTTAGRAKISISYKDFKDSVDIEVYDKVKNLYINEGPVKLEANSEFKIPQVFGQDYKGSSARVYLDDLLVEVTDEVGEITGSTLKTIDQPKSGYLIFKYGENIETLKLNSEFGDASIDLAVPSSTQLEDPLENKLDNKAKIMIGTNTISLNEDEQKLYDEHLNKSSNFVSLNNFYGNWDKNLTSNLIGAGGSYTSSKFDNIYLAALDTRRGGISSSNSYQWTRLQNEIMNRPEKNIIITSQKPLWGEWSFKDQDESAVLHDILTRLKDKGKNVYLVHGGFVNQTLLKDGIRYIGLDIRAEKSPSQIQDLSVVEFYLDGENLNYNFNKIYK